MSSSKKKMISLFKTVETYHKSKKDFKLSPNLPDYQIMYQGFDWSKAESELSWFPDHKLNAAHCAIDRHAEDRFKNKIALYWEGESGETKEFTFWQLRDLSNQFANVLKKHGVERGDRVFVFLPRIPELYYCYLGILKTGAIAGSLFQAFGPAGLLDRLQNSAAKVVVTNNEMKKRVYQVKKDLPHLEKIIVVDGKANGSLEVDFPKEMATAARDFEVAKMDPEEPAFMLYTSGTTGKPKGVVHAHYAILQEHLTTKWVLDLHESDMYWCTADPGWVTGVAYEILGCWSHGASSIVFEGGFDPARWYEIIQKYKVTMWYTAPTAVRMLKRAGDEIIKKYDLSSLRFLCSVGEPLNPEVIRWGLKVYGLPFHDNWWQTECGAIMIANYASLDIRLGSMGKPIPGVVVGIVDDKGNELGPGKQGSLAARPGWPAMMRKIWRRPEKYSSYFIKNAKGIEWYISGDLAVKDEDGYYWFLGRDDDVIKTAGERVGPFKSKVFW